MNILIAVHDITPKNWHLMPWRTVVEVVKNQDDQDSHNIYLVSLGEEQCIIESGEIPVNVISISKSRDKLKKELNGLVRRLDIDTIFWPFTWREPRWRLKIVTGLSARVICWLPGGKYTVNNVLYALRRLSIKLTLPYLIDALYPKKVVVSYLKQRGVSGVLAMTQETANVAINSGWPECQSFSIPPGKDIVGDGSRNDSSIMQGFPEWLDNRKYYLFAGPPSGIRGVYELLSAFDILAEDDPDITLVCLFRSDAKLESVEISNIIKEMKNVSRVYAVWVSVTKSQLNSFMNMCHAIILPFVIVPSEIPLAIIESMRYGKPVITTALGGTGKFVDDIGVSVKLGDVTGLANVMLKLNQEDMYYKKISARVADQYNNHISWKMMSDLWIDVAENTNKNIF